MRIDAVHILAPGPSLASYRPLPADARAFVIAVNLAAEFCPIDAWCALDWSTFHMLSAVQPRGGRLLHISMSSQYATLIRKDREAKWAHEDFAFVERCPWPNPPKGVPDWQSYSATGAIAYGVELARLMGLRAVDLFGFDCEGDADWKGRASPDRAETQVVGGRTKEGRWPKERRAIEWCIAEGRRRMVAVRRHGQPMEAAA